MNSEVGVVSVFMIPAVILEPDDVTDEDPSRSEDPKVVSWYSVSIS